MYSTAYHRGDLKRSTFLVTGGAGFIGSHVVEYLLKHGADSVRVLDNLVTGSEANVKRFGGNKTYEFINGDITDLHACNAAGKGVDFIIHMAALGSVPRSIVNPMATHQTNVDGFINVLLAAREQGVKRVVYASSSSVYGDNTDLPKKEGKTGNPLSPYAVSKMTDELYANVFWRQYGLEVTGLRFFNVFGPRQSPEGPYAAVIPLFARALNEGKSPSIFGDGRQVRDFTFVTNAVQGCIRAVFARDVCLGKVFNIAAGNRISVLELFESMCDISGSSIAPKFLPPRKGDIRNSYADISAAREFLGYEPEIDFSGSLSRTMEWLNRLS